MSALVLSVVAALAPGAPGPQDEAVEVSFHRDVRPILQARCQGCHQPAKPEGDVLLVRHGDLVDALAGGEAAVVPGDPDGSLLVDVITPFGDLPPEMPEDAEPLTTEEIEIIRRWIVAGAKDDTPMARPAREGPPVYVRPPVVTALDFSPDGRLLAVSGRGEVLLHRADGSGLVSRLVGLSERIESVAFSPDGERLAVAGGSPGLMGELQIWNVAAARLDLSLPVTFDTIHGASWSADGVHVAFGCQDNTLRAIHSTTGEEVLYQNAHEDWVLGTAFSSDDSHVVSVGRDRSLKLIKLETQQFIDNITSITPGALRGGLMSVERHPTLDVLLVGGADGVPKTYKMYREKKRVIGDDFNQILAFEALPGRIFSTAWSPDGAHIVAGSSSQGAGEVRVYAAEDGARTWAHSFDAGIYAVAFHPDGQSVAAGGFDGRVWLFAAKDGRVLLEFVPVPLGGEAAEVGVVEAQAQVGEPQGGTGDDS